MKQPQWTSRFERRRHDILPILVIIAFFLLCFFPMIAKGRFFLMLDAFSEMLPERAAAWNAIRHGSLPLWTPLLLSGYPLLSMAQIGLAYPLTWGYLFLPPYWAEQIYVLAPFLLTPAFTYCYARYIGRSATASLLAALAYGYGGVLVIPDIHNGLLPNSTLWLPLFLIAIERARNKDFITSWLLATVPYAMSVFTGIGQGFLFVGLVGLAYALFLVLCEPIAMDPGSRSSWTNVARWRPLTVTVLAMLFSAGLAAFQILETMRAQRRSIRADLTYEMFIDPSLTFWGVIKFVITTPFYSFQDVCTAYVPPIALILTGISLVVLVRRKITDRRVVFWTGAAVSAWILMMGDNTPLYRLLYHIPVVNKFREPPRYAVIWTFAIAILASYGFEAFVTFVSRSDSRDPRDRKHLVTAALLVLMCIGVAVFWSKPWGPDDLSRFLTTKAAFTLLVALLLWQALKTDQRVKTLLVTFTIALGCFVEPFTLIRNWWWPMTKPASRVTIPTAPTRFLQQFSAEQNRVYTFVPIFSEEFNPSPAVDCPNLTMLHGLQNVAGYEPLFLQRYSRALGDVWLDGVTPRKGFPPDRSIFSMESRVLDLLNASYVLTFSNPLVEFRNVREKEGIRFAVRGQKVDLPPGDKAAFSAMAARADTIAIVSWLANSANVEQGTPVAILRVTTMDGRIIERRILAGVDTAEWAHERPDVRNEIRHSLAPVFQSRPEDSFPAYEYWTRLPLGRTESLDRLEVINLTPNSPIAIDKITLFDSTTSASTAVSLSAGPIDFKKWQPVYNENGVMILKNQRVMPRAWLVGEAETVDEHEALRRIRGQSDSEFDPRRTALLEVKPENLPRLNGGVSSESTARISAYEPNRLVVETDSSQAAVLVMSEMSYPGWVATIDGQATPIHTADYLLRAVILPAGKHQVEMRYTAPAARNGMFISVFSLLAMVAAGFYERRRKRRIH